MEMTKKEIIKIFTVCKLQNKTKLMGLLIEQMNLEQLCFMGNYEMNIDYRIRNA